MRNKLMIFLTILTVNININIKQLLMLYYDIYYYYLSLFMINKYNKIYYYDFLWINYIFFRNLEKMLYKLKTVIWQ